MPDNYSSEGEWLSTGSAEVKADLDGIKRFAAQVRAEMTDNFSHNVNNGIKPLLNMQVPFGGTGMKEGMYYGEFAYKARTAVGELLQQAMLGLTAISLAAESVANSYATGDAEASATNQEVLAMFDKKEKGKDDLYLSDVLAKSQQEGASDDEEMSPETKAAVDNLEKQGESEGGNAAADAGHARVYGEDGNMYIVAYDDEYMRSKELNPDG